MKRLGHDYLFVFASAVLALYGCPAEQDAASAAESDGGMMMEGPGDEPMDEAADEPMDEPEPPPTNGAPIVFTCGDETFTLGENAVRIDVEMGSVSPSLGKGELHIAVFEPGLEQHIRVLTAGDPGTFECYGQSLTLRVPNDGPIPFLEYTTLAQGPGRLDTCSIEITSHGPTYTGTFAADLYKTGEAMWAEGCTGSFNITPTR